MTPQEIQRAFKPVCEAMSRAESRIHKEPTLEQAKEFFGIEDTTWAQMLPEEKQTFVDEIMDTPKFRRVFMEGS